MMHHTRPCDMMHHHTHHMLVNYLMEHPRDLPMHHRALYYQMAHYHQRALHHQVALYHMPPSSPSATPQPPLHSQHLLALAYATAWPPGSNTQRGGCWMVHLQVLTLLQLDRTLLVVSLPYRSQNALSSNRADAPLSSISCHRVCWLPF